MSHASSVCRSRRLVMPSSSTFLHHGLEPLPRQSHGRGRLGFALFLILRRYRPHRRGVGLVMAGALAYRQRNKPSKTELLNREENMSKTRSLRRTTWGPCPLRRAQKRALPAARERSGRSLPRHGGVILLSTARSPRKALRRLTRGTAGPVSEWLPTRLTPENRTDFEVVRAAGSRTVSGGPEPTQESKTWLTTVTLTCSEAGQGTPVVLLHGFPLSGAIWNEQRQRPQRSFQVITPDSGSAGAPARRSALRPEDWREQLRKHRLGTTCCPRGYLPRQFVSALLPFFVSAPACEAISPRARNRSGPASRRPRSRIRPCCVP